MPETIIHLTSISKTVVIDGKEYAVSYTWEMGSNPMAVVFIESIDGPCFSAYCRSDCHHVHEQLLGEMDVCKQEFEEYTLLPFEN